MRENYINLQIAEALKSFKEAPAYLYKGSPLEDIKREMDKQTKQEVE